MAATGGGASDEAEAAEADLRRALAERLAGRLREVGGHRPPQIAAPAAFAGIEALRALTLDRAERPAPEALDCVLLAHDFYFGTQARPDLPRKGETA